jgi:hypothetical protein
MKWLILFCGLTLFTSGVWVFIVFVNATVAANPLIAIYAVAALIGGGAMGLWSCFTEDKQRAKYKKYVKEFKDGRI